MKLCLISDYKDGLDKSIRRKRFFVEKYPCSKILLVDPNLYDFIFIFDNGKLLPEEVSRFPKQKIFYFSEGPDQPEESDILKVSFSEEAYSSNFSNFNFFSFSRKPTEWINHCCDEDFFYYSKNEPPVYDCFLNGDYDEDFVEELSSKYKVVFNHSYLTNAKKSYIFKRSKIVVCNNEKDSIDKAIFEAGGCGNFVLANKVPSSEQFERLFEEGVHLVLYDSLKECLQKITLYAQEEGERREIGKTLNKQILKCHTSKRRTKELILKLK